MVDMTLCHDNQCPLHKSCYRFTAKSKSPYQSYFIGSPRPIEGPCTEFVQDTNAERIDLENNTLYLKRGHRYVPIAEKWLGFPKDGVWLVINGRCNQRWLIDDVPDPLLYAAIARHQDVIAREYLTIGDEMAAGARFSANDIADRIVRAIYRAEQERGDSHDRTK